MTLRTCGLVLALFWFWVSCASATTLRMLTPEAREKSIVREMKNLESNPFRGWLQILNYPLYASLHHQLVGVRYIIYNPWGAINYVFGSYAPAAHRVANCEGGRDRVTGLPSVRAHNGQYQGMFQMGSSERRTYGHGPRAIDQARAAYRYFVASGRDWSPWSCKP